MTAPTGAPHPPHVSASALLKSMVATSDATHVSLGDIISVLQDRAFGLILVIFALPNCVPGPPGLGSILGLPCLLVGLQMMAGRRRPWLPEFITKRKIKRTDLAKMLDKATPLVARMERLCKPRLTILTGPTGERWIGLIVVILSLCITIPLPLTNLIPAIGVLIMALGLLEEDGAAAILGAAIGLGGLVVTVTAVIAVIAAIGYAFSAATPL